MRNQDDTIDDGWSITDLVQRVVAGHRALVLASVALGLVLATVYSAQVVPSYRASAELVTGTYSMPPDIGLRDALDGAGPLGLELPAETQARIIVSPAVVSIAIDSLALDQGTGSDLLQSVSASANTDNVFTVSASGRTPEDAVERTNALAVSYLTYRDSRAAERLEPLRVDAQENAERAAAAAADLQPRIDAAEAEESTQAATLTDAQQQHLRDANAEAARAAAIATTLETFGGGGTVVRPANVENVSGGSSTGRWLSVGLLGGLVLGLAAALVVERLRSPVRTGDDVLSVGSTEIALECSRSSDVPVVEARRLWHHAHGQDPGRRTGPWQVSVVPARPGADVEQTCSWLASGFRALGHPAAHAPAGTEPAQQDAELAVALRGYPDVPTLCVMAGRGQDGVDDVVLTVTRGVDSTATVRATTTALEGAGLRILAVVLVPRPRRWPSVLRRLGRKADTETGPRPQAGATQQEPAARPEAARGVATATPAPTADTAATAATKAKAPAKAPGKARGAAPRKVPRRSRPTTRSARPGRPVEDDTTTTEPDGPLVEPGVSRDAPGSR